MSHVRSGLAQTCPIIPFFSRTWLAIENAPGSPTRSRTTADMAEQFVAVGTPGTPATGPVTAGTLHAPGTLRAKRRRSLPVRRQRPGQTGQMRARVPVTARLAASRALSPLRKRPGRPEQTLLGPEQTWPGKPSQPGRRALGKPLQPGRRALVTSRLALCSLLRALRPSRKRPGWLGQTWLGKLLQPGRSALVDTRLALPRVRYVVKQIGYGA